MVRAGDPERTRRLAFYTTLGTFTAVEVIDGFAKGWAFSKEDALMNLAGAGIGELLVTLQQTPGMTAEEYLGTRAAVMRMIDPGAMGRFRVLVLGKDVPDTPPAGLRFTL